VHHYSNISQREFLDVGELCRAEATVAEKLAFFADRTQDPDIRRLCNEHVARHISNYNTLIGEIQRMTGGPGGPHGVRHS